MTSNCLIEKKIHSVFFLRYTLLILIMLFCSYPIMMYSQDNSYEEMLGMERVDKLCKEIYFPKLDNLRSKVTNIEESGLDNYAELIKEFNRNFSKYTAPFSLKEDAKAPAIKMLIGEAKDGIVNYLCTIEKKRSTEFLNYLFDINCDFAADIYGVKRVNIVYDRMYAPLFSEIKTKLHDAANKENNLSYCIRQLNIFLSNYTYELSLEAGLKEIDGYIELGILALKKEMLIKEKKRYRKILGPTL